MIREADARKQKLHDILQIVDVGILQLWARGNPCQIGTSTFRSNTSLPNPCPNLCSEIQ